MKWQVAWAVGLVLVFILGVINYAKASPASVIAAKEAHASGHFIIVVIGNCADYMQEFSFGQNIVVITRVQVDFVHYVRVRSHPNCQWALKFASDVLAVIKYPMDCPKLFQKENTSIPKAFFGFCLTVVDKNEIDFQWSIGRLLNAHPCDRDAWAMTSKKFFPRQSVLFLRQISLASYKSNLRFSSTPELISGVFKADSGATKLEGEPSNEDGRGGNDSAVVSLKKLSDRQKDERRYIVSGALFFAGILAFAAYLWVEWYKKRDGGEN